jgi:hypothetical protein
MDGMKDELELWGVGIEYERLSSECLKMGIVKIQKLR